MRSAPLAPPSATPAARALNPDWAEMLERARIDPTLDGSALQEALHRAIARRGHSCEWTEIYVGWVVTLHFPEQHHFFGQTLEDALAWCLTWVMAAGPPHCP
jgi:hypothetical protein